MSHGSLPDPEDPSIIHISDAVGLRCRLARTWDDDWPSDWWRHASASLRVITCLWCAARIDEDVVRP